MVLRMQAIGLSLTSVRVRHLPAASSQAQAALGQLDLPLRSATVGANPAAFPAAFPLRGVDSRAPGEDMDGPLFTDSPGQRAF